MAAFRRALLDPRGGSGSVPGAVVHDDLSGRVRAARPMTRAEIAQRRTLALVPASQALVPALQPISTFGEGAGAFQTEEDDADLVPVRNRGRGIALVSAATLAGVALAGALVFLFGMPETCARPAERFAERPGEEPAPASVVTRPIA